MMTVTGLNSLLNWIGILSPAMSSILKSNIMVNKMSGILKFIEIKKFIPNFEPFFGADRTVYFLENWIEICPQDWCPIVVITSVFEWNRNSAEFELTALCNMQKTLCQQDKTTITAELLSYFGVFFLPFFFLASCTLKMMKPAGILLIWPLAKWSCPFQIWIMSLSRPVSGSVWVFSSILCLKANLNKTRDWGMRWKQSRGINDTTDPQVTRTRLWRWFRTSWVIS